MKNTLITITILLSIVLIGINYSKPILEAPTVEEKQEIEYSENIEGCIYFLQTKNLEKFRSSKCSTEEVNSYILNVKKGVEM